MNTVDIKNMTERMVSRDDIITLLRNSQDNNDAEFVDTVELLCNDFDINIFDQDILGWETICELAHRKNIANLEEYALEYYDRYENY